MSKILLELEKKLSSVLSQTEDGQWLYCRYGSQELTTYCKNNRASENNLFFLKDKKKLRELKTQNCSKQLEQFLLGINQQTFYNWSIG